jgi:hypothetical protein
MEEDVALSYLPLGISIPMTSWLLFIRKPTEESSGQSLRTAGRSRKWDEFERRGENISMLQPMKNFRLSYAHYVYFREEHWLNCATPLTYPYG